MLYYRFRPTGELALKELLYDELFFASAAECNDPFDGMSFLEFGREPDKWQRLIACAWNKADFPFRDRLTLELVDRILELCPLTYADAIEHNYESTIAGLRSAPHRNVIPFLATRLRTFLTLYRPKPPYFASFSRDDQNPLMWSHYASMHQGHCLIFRDLDGYLEQCPRRLRSAVGRRPHRGLVPQIAAGVPDKFRFEEVSYQPRANTRDAFLIFPGAVYGKGLSEDERRELIASRQLDVLTKHVDWGYEKEVRITLSTQSSWLYGEDVEYTPLERLLYFRPTQLVGLVMGARIPADRQSRLRDICAERLRRIGSDLGKAGVDDFLFDFVLFRARLMRDARDVAIDPIELLSQEDSYFPDGQRFAERMQKWKDGWALHFRNNSVSWQQFP